MSAEIPLGPLSNDNLLASMAQYGHDDMTTRGQETGICWISMSELRMLSSVNPT